MVRIAYRTSSGIYGPKDATFPKVVDVETQLKRCRLREHSLKRCISVLLVVVAFCVCGFIVGLLSTCEDEDNLNEIKDDSTLKPMIGNTQRTGHGEDIVTTGTTADPGFATGTATGTGTLEVTTPRNTGFSNETSQETETTQPETTALGDSETPINLIDIESTVDATTQRMDPTFSTSASIVSVYNDITTGTLGTLSNVQEYVPPCAPSHMDRAVPSTYSDQQSSDSSPVVETSGTLSVESKLLPVPDKEMTSTTVNKREVPVHPRAKSGHFYKRSRTTSPEPANLQMTTYNPDSIRDADPIIKVSFVTTFPVIDINTQ